MALCSVIGGDYHCHNSPVHPDEAFVLFNRLAVQRLLAFAAAQAPPWPPLLPPSTLAKALPFLAQNCRATGVDLVQLNLFEVVHVSGHLCLTRLRGSSGCATASYSTIGQNWSTARLVATSRVAHGSTNRSPLARPPTCSHGVSCVSLASWYGIIYPPGSLLGWAPPTNRFASGGWPARPPMALDAGSDRGLKVGCDRTVQRLYAMLTATSPRS